MRQQISQLLGNRGLGFGLGVALVLGVSAMQTSAIQIGDFVWYDLNANGIQDAGEPGVNGVLVELYSCSGEFIMATNTAPSPGGQDGWYLFEHPYDLYGTYFVKFHAPEGFAFTAQNQGSDTAVDSNPDPATGIAACTTAHDLTQDAGLVDVPTGPGTGTPGYWVNHPDAWPVEEIVIGGVTYTKVQAIAWMSAPVKNDKRLTMFPALVSAKLNVLSGTESGCIAGTVEMADLWMATYGGSAVNAKSEAWKLGEPLYWELDDYNNGLLCAPHRD